MPAQPLNCIKATAACISAPNSKAHANTAATRSCPYSATQPRQAHAVRARMTKVHAAISFSPGYIKCIILAWSHQKAASTKKAIPADGRRTLSRPEVEVANTSTTAPNNEPASR